MGAFTMAWRRLLLVTTVFGIWQTAWAQSPGYGLGRKATAEEIRAWDIAISPTGTELPPGQGTAKEGAAL
jgi:cytochrome c